MGRDGPLGSRGKATGIVRLSPADFSIFPRPSTDASSCCTVGVCTRSSCSPVLLSAGCGGPRRPRSRFSSRARLTTTSLSTPSSSRWVAYRGFTGGTSRCDLLPSSATSSLTNLLHSPSLPSCSFSDAAIQCVCSIFFAVELLTMCFSGLQNCLSAPWTQASRASFRAQTLKSRLRRYSISLIQPTPAYLKLSATFSRTRDYPTSTALDIKLPTSSLPHRLVFLPLSFPPDLIVDNSFLQTVRMVVLCRSVEDATQREEAVRVAEDTLRQVNAIPIAYLQGFSSPLVRPIRSAASELVYECTC